MTDPTQAFNDKLVELIANVPTDLESSEAAAAMKTLESFSNVHKALPDPEPVLPPEPTTLGGKAGRAIGRFWDNETTRALIKAGGAFAGVAVVAHATIKRDHVLERQAIDQANQRNI